MLDQNGFFIGLEDLVVKFLLLPFALHVFLLLFFLYLFYLLDDCLALLLLFFLLLEYFKGALLDLLDDYLTAFEDGLPFSFLLLLVESEDRKSVV